MDLSERPATLKHLPRLGFARGAIATALAQDLTQVPLTREHRHYLERVRRLRVGDLFLGFDSSGPLWKLMLTETGATMTEELQPVQRELPIPLELAIAVTKGSGFDEGIRHLTELGVTSIVPLVTERTVVQPKPKKVERWRAIALEATEQCERVIVPEIEAPMSLKQWLSRSPLSSDKTQPRWIAAARAETIHLLSQLKRTIPVDHSGVVDLAGLAVAIGPEGGWSDQELVLAQEAGVEPIGLGPRVLRAVTAPVAIASVISAYLESE